MTDFLLFTIYAPFASWGDIAVGESRGSWDRPSRSAVLGLVAAALGVVRDDQNAHDALNAGYGVAVRADAVGVALRDYHTAQTADASQVRKARPRTRRELLMLEPQTILSRRTYREDAVATVALWRRAGAAWALERLAGALRRPAFVLYAGRKANVLGAPVDPAVVQAATLADAFMARAPLPRGIASARGIRAGAGWGREVSHDRIAADEGFASGLHPYRDDVRRDVPRHRLRWQFAERSVEVGLLPGPASGTAVEE